MHKIFDGRVALITGGTSGIGRASAIDFAKRGAKVIVTGRREEEGRKTVDLISAIEGDSHFFRADVSNEEDCKNMVAFAVEKFGRLDCAFNNAGIEGDMAPLTQQTTENFHKVMNINVLGVMNSMKYQIQAMLKNGGGAIVNNASIASMIGMPGASIYCASKGAIESMTRAAAIEFSSHGVRINAVSPAAIKTDMYDRFTGGKPEFIEMMTKLHPIGRVGEPNEVAHAVSFLCSAEASFVTGINMPIDGAYTAQ